MSGERLRILVLDDDPTITSLLAEVLGAACAVTVANTIDDARRALEVGCPDLLLSDYLIDGAPSTAFLATVAARLPALRRVLMTGSPNREWRGIIDRGLVVAVLLKPFDLNQLWAVVAPNE